MSRKRKLPKRPPLAVRIRAAREERGLSQARLADILGLSTYHIGALESGLRLMNKSDVVRVAAYLGIPLREVASLVLLGGYMQKVQFYACDDRVLRISKWLAQCDSTDDSAVLDKLVGVVDDAVKETNE